MCRLLGCPVYRAALLIRHQRFRAGNRCIPAFHRWALCLVIFFYPQLLPACPGIRVTDIRLGLDGLSLHIAGSGILAVPIAVFVIAASFLVSAPRPRVTRVGNPCPLTAVTIKITLCVVLCPGPVVAVRPPVVRPGTIPSRPPAPKMPVVPVMVMVPVTTAVVTETERAPSPAQTEIPSAPRAVTDVESPGGVTGIVVIR